MALRRFANSGTRTLALGLLYGAGAWVFNAGVVGLPIAIVLARRVPRLTLRRAHLNLSVA